MRLKTNSLLACAPLVAAGASLATLACAGDPAALSPVIRLDSAGIQIVTNRAPDSLLDWKLMPVLTLGGKERGPEAFGDVWSSNVSSDGKGRLFIVDGDRYRLYAFDTTGRLIFEAGNQGEGPGEMENPWRIIPLSDAVMGIYDAGKRAFIRFGDDGAALPQLKRDWTTATDVVPMDDSLFVYTADVSDVFSPTASSALVFGAGDRRDTLLAIETKSFLIEHAACGAWTGQEPIFSPRLVWGVRDNWLAAAHTGSYEIRLYSRGALSRIVRRQVPPRAATKELALENAPRVSIGMVGGIKCETGREDLVKKVGFEKQVPSIRALMLAPGGELWVLRNTLAGEPRAMDIFGPDGAYVGTVQQVLGIPATFVTDSVIAEVKKDSTTGLPLITLSRVHRVGSERM